MKRAYIYFIFVMSLSSIANAEDSPWDQLSVSVKIQAYVNAIAYEQTDLLCYSYGQLMSDLEHDTNTNIFYGHPNHAYGKSAADLSKNADFNKYFFSDAQFRKSVKEWLFFHADALTQAINNSELTPSEQEAISAREAEQSQGWWGNIKSFLGVGPSNTHSLPARYTQYVTYLVESEGFDTAIRHCATRNNLDQDELKEAMANTLRSHNRNVGIGTGVVALAAVAYTGYHTFGYIMKGFALLGRGMQYLWRLRSSLSKPTSLNLRGPQISQAQKQLVQREMQKLNTQTNRFQSFVESSKRFPIKSSMVTASMIAELGAESGFVLYFAHEMADNMSQNQDHIPEENSEARRNRALSVIMQVSDPYSMRWWRSRLQDYEKLIDRGLRLNRLEETRPQQPETLEARRVFHALLDFYLMDLHIIQREIDDYREQIVDLEKQLHDICPPPNPEDIYSDQSLLAKTYMQYHSGSMVYTENVRCRNENQEQIQDIQESIFNARYSNSYRILRTVLPLFQFRKERLQMALQNTESQIPHKVLFELMESNKEYAYGLCFASLSRGGYNSYQSPLCQFHFLYAKSLLTTLDDNQAHQLQDLYQTLEL